MEHDPAGQAVDDTDTGTVLSLAIVLHGAPYERQGCTTALRLARAAVGSPGHQVLAVALFGAGALLAVADAAAGPLSNLRTQWLSLAESGGFRLLACPAALARRGFQRRVLEPPFELCGMVETLALLARADRLVEFR